MRPRHWSRWMGSWLLSASLLGGAGCLSCLHPVPPASPAILEACQAVPKCGRGHVFIFLLSGAEPTGYANLAGLRDYLQSLGFIKTYYGQLYHIFWIHSEMCRLHQEDPQARFVLIGQGCGGNLAHALAQDLKADNIPLDLLVYLDACTLPSSCPKPDNVARILNISADSCMCKGKVLEGAENITIHKAGCLGATTHPHTLDLLAAELTQVAACVPVQVPAEPTMPEMPPTPRPIVSQPTAERDDWDFLKPVASLNRQPPSLGYHPATPADAAVKSAIIPHTVSKPKEPGAQ